MGQRAPGFTLEGATKEGPLSQPFDLSLQRGRVTVLAFYPRDFTSGCTAEFQTFRDRGADIFGEGVTVVGISIDSVQSHVAFAQQIGHPYALLADPDLRVANRPGYRVSWQSTLGATPAEVFEDNLKPWSADHCSLDPASVPGILFSSRAPVRPDPSIVDVMPTVLGHLGVAVPEDLDGESFL